MIGHCLQRARLASKVQEVYLATCDQEIADYGRSIGVRVIMTSDSHRRASTRTAEALATIQKLDPLNPIETVLMIQGDEPLITPDSMSEVIEAFSDPTLSIVNLLSRIVDVETFRDKNNVKTVIDSRGRVLYFSREPIPCDWTQEVAHRPLLQTGVIGFRVQALAEFNAMPETSLEVIESIDMNRVLESAGVVNAVILERPTLGVDTRDELARAEALLREDAVTYRYIAR